MRAVVLFCLLFCSLLQGIWSNRAICYSGSSLYQLTAMDCTAQDSTVSEDDWYCVKAEMCEQYISGNRVCAVTRGCATATQCTDSSGSIYNNDVVLSNSNNPGGVKFKVTCCQNDQTFADDDTVALDYSVICNDASHKYNFQITAYTMALSILASIILMYTARAVHDVIEVTHASSKKSNTMRTMLCSVLLLLCMVALPIISSYSIHARLYRRSSRLNSIRENSLVSSILNYDNNGKTIEYIPSFVVGTNTSIYNESMGNVSVNSVFSSANVNSSKRGFLLDKDRVKMKTRRDGSMFNDKLSSKIYSDYDFDDEFDELDDDDDDEVENVDDDELVIVDYDKPNLLPNISLYNWKFGAGIRNDIKRRLPHYKSDWTDGFHRKSISAILYLYFACLAPTVAFGGLTNILTDGKIGVTDFIMSCGISGMIYAVFAGQPMTFLGPTGLTLAFITSLYKFTEAASLPFIGIYGWTGLWTALFLALSAFTNTSYLIRLCTRFTDDVFNALLAVNFLYEASKNLLLNFTKVNASMVTAFASFNLAMVTWMASRSVAKFRRGKLFNKKIRKLISDFGPTAVLLGLSYISTLPMFTSFGIERLKVPQTFSLVGRWKWTTDFLVVPTTIRWLCSIPAVLLTMLFFLDQNISVRAVNACKLKKGDAYHMDLLLLSFIVGGLSLFGLPWTCAATVQSLNHVRSMADIEDIDGSEKWNNIIETRLTGFSIHSAILGSIFLLPILAHVPMPVISGVFLYLGRKLMKGNLFFDRLGQFFMESRLLGDRNAYKLLPRAPIAKYLSIQSIMLMLIWGLKSNQKLALFFPSCIALLMITRIYALPKLFTKKELIILDPVM